MCCNNHGAHGTDNCQKQEHGQQLWCWLVNVSCKEAKGMQPRQLPSQVQRAGIKVNDVGPILVIKILISLQPPAPPLQPPELQSHAIPIVCCKCRDHQDDFKTQCTT